MSQSESNFSQDSTGAQNENSSTPTDAGGPYCVKTIKTLPDFSFRDYLRYVEPLGNEIEIKYGIFHLVPMIQSAHESRNGNSGLARNHGNLFGIKATKSWKDGGNIVALMPTKEFIKGHQITVNQEFRGYFSWRDSFFDWGRLISTIAAYKRAYELLRDKMTVPQGIELMALSYATDPVYARKLRAIYEQVLKEGFH